LSDYIYQSLRSKVYSLKLSSVHLEDWPKAKEKLIKKDLNEKMELVRKIVSLGLELRTKAKIKVRQPLSKLQIANCKIQNEFINLVKDELNVKEIEFVKEIEEEKNWILGQEEGIKIALNIEITPQLKEEGMIRDFIREIQDLRKKARLKPKDKILIQVSGGEKLKEFLLKNKKSILKEIKAKDLQFTEKLERDFIIKKEVEIENEKVELGIKNLKHGTI
jgi:isoleucyl-tRNA synthetase